MNTDRPLTDQEIDRLQQQGCHCPDWSRIRVAAGFRTQRIWHSHFEGSVRLGRLTGSVETEPGCREETGLCHARLRDCHLDDDVLVRHVPGGLHGLHVESGAVVERVQRLWTAPDSACGQGTTVAVVNEAGGREFPIFSGLSGPLAYLMTFRRDRPGVIAALEAIVDRHVQALRTRPARIGRGARLRDCGCLLDCTVGPAAILDQVTRLERVTVDSDAACPTILGPGVVARDVVIAPGTRVTDGCLLERCFVGPGTRLQRFTATASVFLANCEAFLGEANALFAGPHTVSHHQGTLLIAMAASFLNAGNGTHQSNHMYRLGPVHQGILERGCKTGSAAYLCWPSHIGAFTFVRGRHPRHLDTRDLPFSVLLEHDGRSVVHPGVLLGSVGLWRDLDKWPGRDRRPNSGPGDWLHYDGLSPFTGQRIRAGLAALEGLEGDRLGAVHIPPAAREQGIRFYRAGLKVLLAEGLVRRLEQVDPHDRATCLRGLAAVVRPDHPEWVDWAGLYGPRDLADDLLADLEAGRVADLARLNGCFDAIARQYPLWHWAWCLDLQQQLRGKRADQWTGDDVVACLQEGLEALAWLEQQRRRDGLREFSETMQIGYGFDGGPEARRRDFEAVRGRFVEPRDDRPAAWTAWAERLRALT